MFKFPKYEPEIRIVELPGEDMEVVCRDAMSYFVLLKVGAENEFSFYDYPKEDTGDRRLVFTGAQKERVTRRIKVDDFEMLEIKAYYREPGAIKWADLSYINRVVCESGLRDKVEIETDDGITWVYKAGTVNPEPTVLRPGVRAEGRSPLYMTGAEPDNLVRWVTEVVGVCEVGIGPNTYKCLKVLWAQPEGDKPSAVEKFIADTGRTVLFRRYNGLAYYNYEELAGNPEMEFLGVTWRHWYDSIPEHALIVGGE